MTAAALRAKFNAKIAAQTTPRLLEILVIMNDSEKAGEKHDSAERMTFAAICDELERRLELTDAMEDIFMDLDYTGTYGDAMLEAIKRVAA